jgi:hypothetical protein
MRALLRKAPACPGPSAAMNPEVLLHLWCERARRSSEAHFRLAVGRSRMHTIFTVVVVVSSAFVSSALFQRASSTAAKSDSHWYFVLAVVSILAAAVASLQRVLDLASEAEKHRKAGADWDRVFDQTCLAGATAHPGTASFDEQLTVFEIEMARITNSSPGISQRMFGKVGLEQIYLQVLGHPLP